MPSRSSLAAAPVHRPSAPATIRVLIATRAGLTRRKIRAILRRHPDLTVVVAHEEPRVADAATRHLRPHVVIADGGRPHADGNSTVPDLGPAVAGVPVLVVARHADRERVRATLRAGAAGYLLEDALDLELAGAVLAVAGGRRFLSAAVQRLVVEDYLRPEAARGVRDGLARLTGREREILQLIAEGRARGEIARLLAVQPSTVDTHRQSMMVKLDLHNVAQLVRFAMHCRLVR